MPIAQTQNGIVTISPPVKITNALDKGIYLLRYDPEKNLFYLEHKDIAFSTPNKIYNNPQKIIDMWIKSWKSTENNLGILLTGLKGSGKSVTAKMLCNQLNAPVIIITEAFTGDNFINFLSAPELKGSVIFFDEFEKIYGHKPSEDKPSSENLLSIVEGVFNTNLLFLFTSNTTEINNHFINRPGRIRFLQQFSSLKTEECIEIVDDLLLDKAKKEDLLNCLEDIDDLSLDIVTKIIHEVNIHDVLPSDIIGHMNISLVKGDYELIVDILSTINSEDSEGQGFNVLPTETIIRNMRLSYHVTNFEIPKLKETSVNMLIEFSPLDATHIVNKLKSKLPELRLEGTHKDFELYTRMNLNSTNFKTINKNEFVIVKGNDNLSFSENLSVCTSASGMFKKIDSNRASVILDVTNIRLRKIKQNKLAVGYT